MDNESFVLYKFRAINKRLIESLVNQTLYFARVGDLNDPFDCRIDLQRAFRRAEMSTAGARRDFLSSFLANPQFFTNWRLHFDAMGVYCCSRTIEETLLWSHYADKHSGVCLEYKFLGKSLIGEITAAQNVDYLDDPLVPWLVGSAPLDMTEFGKELALRYLRTKSPAWAYEQEARIIRQESGPFKFRGVLLMEVCFGLRTPKADVDLVVKIVQSYCGEVKFSRMVPDQTEFSFVKEAL